MPSDESSEPILQRLFNSAADILFTEREESSKYISDISGASVTETGLTHAARLGIIAVLALFGALLAKFWMEVHRVLEGGGTGEAFVLGMIGVLFVPFTLGYLYLVPKVVWEFYKKHECEHCGAYVRYPHKLTRAKPDTFPTESESYYFCSREHRENFERKNMDYNVADYYSLQTERDEDHYNALAEEKFFKDEF